MDSDTCIHESIKSSAFVARFWAKVAKTTEDDCWEWIGRRNWDGYGQISANKITKSLSAHRVAYAIANGELPPKMCVCHSCDNPACVNPKHLWIGTKKDNTADAVAKGRHFNRNPNKKPRKKGIQTWDVGSLRRNLEFCKRGHPFDEQNTGKQAKGRYCKACEADRKKQERARKRGTIKEG